MPGTPASRRRSSAASGCCRPPGSAAGRVAAVGIRADDRPRRADRDRLFRSPTCRVIGAVPVPARPQVELLAQRTESRKRRLEHVTSGLHVREGESSGRVSARLDFHLRHIFERHVDAGQDGAGRVVDRSRQQRRAGLPGAQRRGRQRDRQQKGGGETDGPARQRLPIESRDSTCRRFSFQALRGAPSARPAAGSSRIGGRSGPGRANVRRSRARRRRGRAPRRRRPARWRGAGGCTQSTSGG